MLALLSPAQTSSWPTDFPEW